MADLAKETVKKWKNDVAGHKKPEGGGASTTTTTTTASTTAVAGKGTSSTLPTKASSDTGAVRSAIANGIGKAENVPPDGGTKERRARDAKKDGLPTEITLDKARDGSIHLLYNAIVLHSDECSPSPHVLPVDI